MFLDIKTNEEASWIRVPIDGNTPGLRFGPSMVYIMPILILFGAAVWVLSTDKAPVKWKKMQISGNSQPRESTTPQT